MPQRAGFGRQLLILLLEALQVLGLGQCSIAMAHTCGQQHSRGRGGGPQLKRLDASPRTHTLELTAQPARTLLLTLLHGAGQGRFSPCSSKSQAPSICSIFSTHLHQNIRGELRAQGSKGLSERRARKSSFLSFHRQTHSRAHHHSQGRAPSLDGVSCDTIPRGHFRNQVPPPKPQVALGHTQVSIKGRDICLSLGI